MIVLLKISSTGNILDKNCLKAIIRYAVFYHIWTVQSEGGGGESRKGGGGSWRKRGTQFLGGRGQKWSNNQKEVQKMRLFEILGMKGPSCRLFSIVGTSVLITLFAFVRTSFHTYD